MARSRGLGDVYKRQHLYIVLISSLNYNVDFLGYFFS
jgi:hypothetical protein